MLIRRLKQLLDADKRRKGIRLLGFRLARRMTPFLGVAGDGVRYVVSTREPRGQGMGTFVNGSLEEKTMTKMLSALGWESLQGKTVLEVGANIGTETVSMIVRHGAERVIAVEPDPENVRFLRANVALNGVESRVDVHHMALSDADGTLTLELSQDNCGDHRIRVPNPAGPTLANEGARPTVEITARTLDSLNAVGVIKADEVDLVWMDTQGYEAYVLAGATCLAAIPVMTEYWPYGLRRVGALERFHELIADRLSFDLDSTGPYSPDDFSKYTNLVLFPSPASGAKK